MTEQDNQGHAPQVSQIMHPPRPLHRKYYESIFYLADRMCSADGEVAPNERRLLEELSKAAGVEDFRSRQTFRHMTIDDACSKLDIDTAKNGAMVIMTLLLKADTRRRDTEQSYFSKVREKLGAPPVHVPVSLEAHKALALEYIKS